MAEKLRDLTFSPETIQDDTNLLLGGELAAGFATDILNRLFVFHMLMVILLCFSLKVADVSLTESGHLVPWRLTSHNLSYGSMK